MATESTVELEKIEDKPLKKPILPTDQRHSYSKDILKWIAYRNKHDDKENKG